MNQKVTSSNDMQLGTKKWVDFCVRLGIFCWWNLADMPRFEEFLLFQGT